MRILLHFPDVPGATLAGLARQLLARGHVVGYSVLGPEGLHPPGCIPLHMHPRWRLGELLDARRATADEPERDWLRLEIEARVACDFFDGEMLDCVRAFGPDLIVADSSLFSPLQFVAHALRVPCLQLSLTFARRWSELPPLTCDAPLDAAPLRIAGARWEGSCLMRRVSGMACPAQVASAMQRLATWAGYPAAEISLASGLAPSLTRFPEALACESALDFASVAGAQYLAIERPAGDAGPVPATLAAWADSGRPLVYVTLGVESLSVPVAPAIWQAIAAAVGEPGSGYAVIVAGAAARAGLPDELNANVLVLEDPPHEWLLQRAALVVTSATLDTLRAAVAHQVPLIAIPLEADQPGNAARIVHHGLGVRLRPELLSAPVLATAIRDVLARPEQYRTRQRRLDEACREEGAQQAALHAIERMLPVATVAVRQLSPAPAARRGAHAVPLAELDEARPEELLEYTSWCVRRTLAPLHADDSDRVEVINSLVERYCDLRSAAASGDELQGLRREVCERALPHWHRGYGVAVCAVHPQPRRAALLTRLEAAAALASAAAGTSGSDTERSQRFAEAHAAASRELDAELVRRLGTAEVMAR